MSKELHSLYLHFPYCRSHCNYCDFYSELGHSPSKLLSYEATLYSAWNKQAELLQKNDFIFGPLETLYFGGGTPSLWGTSGLEFFKKFLKEKDLRFALNYEWTIEMNPAAYTNEVLGSWEDIGLNRYSVGIQTLDPDYFKKLGRTHSLQESFLALKFLQGKNYSADLMLGLPFSEGKRKVLEELKKLLEFSPKHLSVYILTVDETYPYFKNLPSEEWIEEEYLSVSDFLQSQGFVHYEISNFSKSNFEAKHNLQYWKSHSVAALGPSATGLLTKNETALRYKWNDAGTEFELEELNEQAFKLEKFYMRFRTQLGFEVSEFFSEKEGKLFEELLESWEKRGLLAASQNGPCLSAKGYLLLDALMDELFIKIKTF